LKTNLSSKCRYKCTHSLANSKRYSNIKQKYGEKIWHFYTNNFQMEKQRLC